MMHRPAASALVLAFALLLALGIVSSNSAATSGASGKSDSNIIPGRYIVVLRGGRPHLRKDRAMGDKSPKNTSKTKKQKAQKKAAAAPKPAPKK